MKYDNLAWTRKPMEWADIYSDEPKDLTGLKRADILGKTPIEEFTAPAPAQYFIAKNEHGYFLVNTEGYTYPRYILRIEGHVEPEELCDLCEVRS